MAQEQKFIQAKVGYRFACTPVSLIGILYFVFKPAKAPCQENTFPTGPRERTRGTK
jgi:hypothetical protein